MRCISVIIIIISISSCTALKPVIGSSANHAPLQGSSQTGFIENISISPGQPDKDFTLPPLHNTAVVNTFSVQSNISEAFIPIQFKYAILMDVPVEALDNLKLFAFIDDWYGAPYHFGGSSKTGVDCSAFSCNLMTTVFGIGLPRMAKDQFQVCEHVKRDDLEEGDLVFFHTTRKGISHVGVYLGNNKFVHASLNYGVTISDLTDSYYARAFRSGGRVRENATASGN
ncbi:MAG: NlpC/P60 family protein [Bacteroidota bacterium]